MQVTHTPRRLIFRFVTVFFSTFVFFFALLNVRFIAANIKFWIMPGTIRVTDSLQDAIRTLPLAERYKNLPLPNRARLVIDSIGIDAPIVFEVASDEKSVYRHLEYGVVHYSDTPKPGPDGVSVILGHSSAYPWYKGAFGSVFALLSKLKPGDKFYVQYEDGRLFIYEIERSLVFNPFGNDERLREIEQSKKPSLVLLSCWPVGTNYRRIAVQANLIAL